MRKLKQTSTKEETRTYEAVDNTTDKSRWILVSTTDRQTDRQTVSQVT